MKHSLSWFVALSAYVVPPVWAYFAIERDTAEQIATHGLACGTPALGMTLLSCLASGALSLLATGIRGWTVGWWKGALPSAIGTEITALTFPLFAAFGFAVYVFFR